LKIPIKLNSGTLKYRRNWCFVTPQHDPVDK